MGRASLTVGWAGREQTGDGRDDGPTNRLPRLTHTTTIAEVSPVEVKSKKGVELMTTDEHPRPNAELAKMAKLSPVFKKEG